MCCIKFDAWKNNFKRRHNLIFINRKIKRSYTYLLIDAILNWLHFIYLFQGVNEIIELEEKFPFGEQEIETNIRLKKAVD